jgi:hypothetical protein
LEAKSGYFPFTEIEKANQQAVHRTWLKAQGMDLAMMAYNLYTEDMAGSFEVRCEGFFLPHVLPLAFKEMVPGW